MQLGQLGQFDWGSLFSTFAQAGVQYAKSAADTRAQLAIIKAKTAADLAAQKRALDAAYASQQNQPFAGAGGLPSLVPRQVAGAVYAAPAWIVPAAVGVGALLLFVAVKRMTDHTYARR